MVKVKYNDNDHTYIVRGKRFGSVTDILQNMGYYDFSAVNRHVLERACARGTAIHETLQYLDQGVLHKYNYDKKADPYIEAWEKFKNRFRAIPYIIEKPLASSIWQFAGTPDRVFQVGDYYILVDLKTGQDMPYHDLQTAGYVVLVEENFKIKIKKRMTVRLIPHKYKVYHHTENVDRSIFLGSVQGYNWKVNKKVIKL